jgi:hypothetical protein
MHAHCHLHPWRRLHAFEKQAHGDMSSQTIVQLREQLANSESECQSLRHELDLAQVKNSQLSSQISMMQDRVDEQHTLMMHGVPSATPPPALLPVSVLRNKDTGRVRWEPTVEETHGGRTLSRTDKDRGGASPEPVPVGTAADQAFAMVLEKERKQQGVLRSQVAQLMQQVLKLKDEQQKLQQTAHQPFAPTTIAPTSSSLMSSTKQDVDHLIRSSTTSTAAAAAAAASASETVAWPQAL